MLQSANVTLSLTTFLIICPLAFLGGFVDSIGGGGGLISLPAYLLAGIPTHLAIATNKLSAAMGTTISTLTFVKEKLINFRLAIPTILAACIGSYIGSSLSLLASEALLRMLLIPVLLIAAFFVLNRKLFGRDYPDMQSFDRRTCSIAVLAALGIGIYDGFYGPGTGTFLIIILNVFAHLNLRQSNAQTKAINLTTNYTSLYVFISGGQVIWLLGLTAGLFGIAGNYLGARLALKSGEKITRPIILIVLVLLLIKLLTI